MAANDSPEPGGRAVGELTYTEASRELDDIVRFFEQREVDVDQLVGRLERATAIVDELDRRLRRTRGQVEELVPRLAAVLSPEAPPDDDDVEDQAAEEVELDEADELVEALEGGVTEDPVTEDPVTEDGVLDDGDPGPTEPPGLF